MPPVTGDKNTSEEDRTPQEGYPLPASVECPFCRGTDTRIESPFGSVLSVAQYYCRGCRIIFEWIKRDPGTEPPAP
jgi:hypothetical protein